MTVPSSVRVGVVLPESFYGEEEWRNAEAALRFADEAAAGGASFSSTPRATRGR